MGGVLMSLDFVISILVKIDNLDSFCRVLVCIWNLVIYKT